MGKTYVTIDDSACVRHMVAIALKSEGHRVLEASNGLEGYNLATTQRVDGVFVDLSMPVMGGLEFLRKFRRHPAGKRVPVVLLTGGSDEACQREARDAGADAWMMKPFDLANLLRVMPK